MFMLERFKITSSFIRRQSRHQHNRHRRCRALPEDLAVAELARRLSCRRASLENVDVAVTGMP